MKCCSGSKTRLAETLRPVLTRRRRRGALRGGDQVDGALLVVVAPASPVASIGGTRTRPLPRWAYAGPTARRAPPPRRPSDGACRLSSALGETVSDASVTRASTPVAATVRCPEPGRARRGHCADRRDESSAVKRPSAPFPCRPGSPATFVADAIELGLRPENQDCLERSPGSPAPSRSASSCATARTQGPARTTNVSPSSPSRKTRSL